MINIREIRGIYVRRKNQLYGNWSAKSCYASTAAFNDCYGDLTPYIALALSELLSTTRINAKATPINYNDYGCHITAVELV